MKVAEWKRVVRPLLPVGERWEFRGPMCYRAPVSRVLMGALGEGSGFDTGVYVWHVVMPLFVPHDVVVLTWSERQGRNSTKYYQRDDGALTQAISAAIAAAPTELQALRRFVSLGEGTRNRYVAEVTAYSMLFLGEIDDAEKWLERAAAGETGPPWEAEIVTRVRAVQRLLEDDGVARAIRFLDAQATATATALGLIHDQK